MSSLTFGTAGTDFQERIDFARMRRERLAKFQAALKKHGIAACLLFDNNNIRYASGVRGASYMPGLRYAVGFAEHDPVIWELGDTLDRNREHCAWVKPENWRYSYSWLHGIAGPDGTRATAKKFAAGIANDLKEKGLDKEKLGFDRLDGVARQALTEAGIQLTDANAAITEARVIKTKDELNCIRMVLTICNVGYQKAYETLKLGLRQCDVYAEVMGAIIRAGAEFATVGVNSGPDTFELYHVPNTDKIIDLGDLVHVRFCGTNYMGYAACIYRTFIVGRKPNQKEKDWYKKCYDRVYSVIAEIKAGATTADAAKRFLPASTWGYKEEDPLLESELGHGMGMSVEEPIISRIWSFDYPQTFESGMIIAVESREGDHSTGGVRVEEMVLVTDTGTELLTTWPSEEIMLAGQLPLG